MSCIHCGVFPSLSVIRLPSVKSEQITKRSSGLRYAPPLCSQPLCEEMMIILRFFKFVVQAVALIVAIGVPILAVYEVMHPWSVAQKFVDQERRNFIPVAVGIAATGDTVTRKSYALIPKGLNLPAILSIEKAETGQVTAEKEDPLSFWFLIAFFLYGSYLLFGHSRWIYRKLRTSHNRDAQQRA